MTRPEKERPPPGPLTEVSPRAAQKFSRSRA